MARMIPQFNSEVDLDAYLPNEYGEGKWWERKLYELMRDEFPDEWTVFHHQYSHDGQYRHEYDFLVFVPGKGIVNLDAKGNGWGFQDGRWFRARNNIRQYDDPIRQAEHAIETVNNIIKSKVSKGEPWGGYGYCLAFAGAINCPSMEPVIMQDGNRRMQTNHRSWAKELKEKIKNILDCPNAKKYQRFFTPRMEGEIKNFYQVPYVQNPVRSDDFRAWDSDSDRALTCRQRVVAAQLSNVDVLHVIGAAGTGKTVVATHLLRESRKRGEKALYVCYNRALAETIIENNRDLRCDEKIVLSNFDRLPFVKMPRLGELRRIVDFNAPLGDWALYRKLIRDALDRFSSLHEGPFNLIVVDEAQDLCSEDIVSLYNLLAFGGKMVVFSDKGQTLFNADWDFSPSAFGEVEYSEVVLNENWRNSSLIHEHYKDYAEIEPPISVLQDCRIPVQNIDADVKGFVRKLICEDNRDPRDIVILSCRVESLRNIEGIVSGTTCKIIQTDAEKITKDRGRSGVVVAATVQSFKGLESPIVILVMGEQGNATNDEWDRLRYVAESRAKYELYIVK